MYLCSVYSHECCPPTALCANLSSFSWPLLSCIDHKQLRMEKSSVHSALGRIPKQFHSIRKTAASDSRESDGRTQRLHSRTTKSWVITCFLITLLELHREGLGWGNTQRVRGKFLKASIPILYRIPIVPLKISPLTLSPRELTTYRNYNLQTTETTKPWAGAGV